MLGAGALGARALLAVGLGHDQRVGELEHALLEPLQLVARARLHEHQEEVDHRVDRDLGLPDPDRLDEHHVVAGRLAHEHRLARALRDAAERAARGRRPDEGALVLGEPLHARLVAEDAAARHRAAGIDREHRHAVALREQVQPERLDEGALADARAGP